MPLRYQERPVRNIVWLLAGLALLAVIVLTGFYAGWPLAAALLLALAGWGAALYLVAAARRRMTEAQDRQVELSSDLQRAQERLRESEQHRAGDRQRLEAVMHLTRGLAEAQDEKALMDAALSTLTGLVGALGCSFVPVDDWDQPLPAFTFGQLPEPVLSAWAAHLTDGLLRNRCADCQLLKSSAGMCPLHPQSVGSAMTVYCLPLNRAGENPVNGAGVNDARGPGRRTLGVFHLYLPADHSLDGYTRGFLDSLLRETALAYENAHLRAQELATLRQLQLLRATESDFSGSLGSLLEGLKQALEADCLLVRLRPTADKRLSNLIILSGEHCGLEDQVDGIFERILRGERAVSASKTTPAWLALPLVLPEGQVLGMLMASTRNGRAFHPRQEAVLDTVASQAALLIENERLIRSLEYKVVVQERARLAREIHDGLAQTLAFLKLQAAQMQSYLAQSDLDRLSEVLGDNYQVLAEAYLDTRQAIDNLRLTPEQGLAAWLERILSEFEDFTSLPVERAIHPDTEPLAQAVPPEIQAQLIRIVQEVLSNVRKHAQARRVWAGLSAWQGQLVLEIADDGRGFDAQDVPELSRYGLRGMRERAELIGADFQITSHVGQGTTVRLALPVTQGEGTPQ